MEQRSGGAATPVSGILREPRTKMLGELRFVAVTSWKEPQMGNVGFNRDFPVCADRNGPRARVSKKAGYSDQLPMQPHPEPHPTSWKVARNVG